MPTTEAEANPTNHLGIEDTVCLIMVFLLLTLTLSLIKKLYLGDKYRTGTTSKSRRVEVYSSHSSPYDKDAPRSSDYKPPRESRDSKYSTNHRHSGLSKKGNSSKQAESTKLEYPSSWSDWERDDEKQRYVSYRLTAPGMVLLSPEYSRTPADIFVQGNTNTITGTIIRRKGRTATRGFIPTTRLKYLIFPARVIVPTLATVLLITLARVLMA